MQAILHQMTLHGENFNFYLGSLKDSCVSNSQTIWKIWALIALL